MTQHITLPARIDEFITLHISYLDGAIKLAAVTGATDSQRSYDTITGEEQTPNAVGSWNKQYTPSSRNLNADHVVCSSHHKTIDEEASSSEAGIFIADGNSKLCITKHITVQRVTKLA
jgi:hypothetical protein